MDIPKLVALMSLLPGLTIPLTAQQQIVSTFGNNADGWTPWSPNCPFEYRSSGGNPGGFLYVDNPETVACRLLAPSKFYGDLSAFYGGTISFDGKMFQMLDETWDGRRGTGGEGFNYGTITVGGPAGVIQIDIVKVPREPAPQFPPWNDWQRHTGRIVAGHQTLADGAVVSWTDQGLRPVDEARIKAVLKSVNRIDVNVEASFGREIQGFDNFILTAGQPSASTSPPTAANTSSQMALDPIATATGELVEIELDLDLGGPLPFTFQRFYGSALALNNAGGALGVNWMHNFEVKLTATSSSATIILFPGRIHRFQAGASGWVQEGAERLNHQLESSGSGFRFLDASTNLVYSFNPAGSLTRIENRRGNVLAVTPGPQGPVRVEDGLGRSLAFRYQGSSLIEVADQTGRRFQFVQGGGNLIQVIDANGKSYRYNYAAGPRPGLSVEKILPKGNRPVSTAYDDQGRVVRQADSRGNTARLQYDASSGVTTLTDPLSNVSRHTHNNQRDLTGHADAAGRSTGLTFDPRRRLMSVTDRRGGRSTFTYDSAGNLTSMTDPAGSTTRLTWSPQAGGSLQFHNLTALSQPDGSTFRYSYDAGGNLTAVIDPAGKAWTYTYNSRGQLQSSRNPAGGVTTSAFNEDGTRASITLPSGDTIRFEYDERKRPVRVVWPDGTPHIYAYNSRDQVVSFTDERGKITSYVYDDNGRLARWTDPLKAEATITYDGNERLSQFSDRLGKATRLVYDAAGRLSRIVNAVGETTTLARDAVGRLSALNDAAGLIGRYSRDPEGGITGVSDGAANSWSVALDAAGRISSLTNPGGGSSRISYNPAGRPASFLNPMNERADIEWEPRGVPSQVTLSGGISAQYTYNDLGLPDTVVDPNGGAWRFGFDLQGQLTANTDPLGRTTTYSYDNRQRVRQVRFPDGGADLSYDPAGNLLRQQYSDGTDLRYAYDDNNRLVSGSFLTLGYDAEGRITNSNGLRIGRDDIGRITSVTYAPDKTVTYSYNNRGLLSRVTDWRGGTTEFGYSSTTQLVSIRRPNGVATQHSYDAAGRLIRIAESGPSVSASIAFGRDASGRVTTAQRDLPTAPDPPAGSERFAYDAAHQETGNTSSDGLGRLTSVAGTSYTWDLASRLSSVRTPGGSRSFTYDALGQMVAGQYNYVWNYSLDLPSIAIFRVVESDLRYFVHLPNGTLLYSIEAASERRRFYHFDEVGNTTFLTGDGGTVTDSYGVTPYGEIVNRSGTSENPFVFQGQFGALQVEADLYYMRARWYDAASARFLSRDPLLSFDPRRLSPYPYAFGNPVDYIDPTGLCGELADRAIDGLLSILIGSGSLIGQYGDFMMADYYAMRRNYFTHLKSATSYNLLFAPRIGGQRQYYPAGWAGWAREGLNAAYERGRPFEQASNLAKGLAGFGIVLDTALTVHSGVTHRDDPVATALNAASTTVGDACTFAAPQVAVADLATLGAFSGGISNAFRSAWVVPGIFAVDRFSPAEAKKVERWYTGKLGTRFIWWVGEGLAEITSTPTINCGCVVIPNGTYYATGYILESAFGALDWVQSWVR